MRSLEYIFDEYDEQFRHPQGALRQGATLTLRLGLKRSLARAVSVVCWPDSGEAATIPLRWSHSQGAYELFAGTINPDRPDLYWFYFQVETGEQTLRLDKDGLKAADSGCSPFQLTVYDQDLRTPDWIKGGIMYHIFVDRYYRGQYPLRLREGAVAREDWGGCPVFQPDEEGIVRNNDFFGGNLPGIIEKLPLLAKMGVTCLYLSPIFEAASNHKYDTGDFQKLDPGFGDGEIFTDLCQKAAALGMRVILDGVFSHVGADSVYFNQYGHYDSLGAYQSQESPYYPWFTFYDWNTVYESWWGIRLLPAANKRNESYQRFITGEDGVAAHWLRQGAGGWRLDVVDEIPDEFLDPLCARIKQTKADALIIGEVWEDASNKIAYGARRRYLLGGQLDSVMNYPLKDAIIKYIKEKDAEALAGAMAWLTLNYPGPALDALMNILGTHDTMRILTVLGGEGWPGDKEAMSRYRLSEAQRLLGKRLLKIAAALQFTLPGFPCVYYGDEAGMEGGADPFNRACYPWGREDQDLLAWYRHLAQVRHALPAFKSGRYRLYRAGDGLFAFTRGTGATTVLIAANVTENDIELPGAEAIFADSPPYEWLSERTNRELGVPALGAAIYAVKKLSKQVAKGKKDE
ncbi:MAG: DUF3459 domain-containing protein [Peptococcaceae bacterium]|nr:DUF3459 domain-containing protein [Peptococcaceae bacterium]